MMEAAKLRESRGPFLLFDVIYNLFTTPSAAAVDR